MESTTSTNAITAATATDAAGSIFCVFKTHLAPEFQFDETQLNISSSLNEKTLNEYLVQLLQAHHDDEEESKYSTKRFEFLINGEFLRGTLRSHILKHNLLSEKTIEIWYTFSLSAPQESGRAQEEDWVSGLALVRAFHQSKLSPVVASLYNGSISVYSESLAHLHRQQLTDSSIRAVAVQANFLVNNSTSDFLVYSACDDETLRVGQLTYTVSGKGKAATTSVVYTELADCVGSTSQLQCLDLNLLRNDLVCAGNYKGDILVYSLSQKNLDESTSVGSEGASRKKVKLSKKSMTPITAINGAHNDKISNIFWKDSDRILTSSHDHHIKIYDTTKQAEANDITCKDSAITSMFPTANLILSGHEDNQVKAWDLREKAPVKTFKSHTSWISSIRGLESDENVFMTTSYDHTVKIWDMRSTFPMFTLKTHHEKVLCGVWNSNASIITGGSDNEIVSHVFRAD